MDFVEAVRVIALRDVANTRRDPPQGDSAYLMRTIRRWYSREFATPLSDVEDLPDEEVLQHYFECKFEALEPRDLDEEITDAVMAPEERAKRDRGAAAEDVDMHRFAEEVRAEEEARRKKQAETPKEPPKSAGIPEIDMNFGSDFDRDLVGR